RGIAALLGGALLLAALLILGRELIAAQEAQRRAPLEKFIRHETGLEITCSRLSVRWGWYGPEAVFDSAALGEPDAPAVLRAAQVVVAVDAWRSMRSGQLEAGRIRLINPEIDLTGHGSDAVATTDGRRAGSASALADAPRWLARWRGGRVDIENGAVRWPGAPGASALTVNVRRAQLRRRRPHGRRRGGSARSGAPKRPCCCPTVSAPPPSLRRVSAATSRIRTLSAAPSRSASSRSASRSGGR